ncbi:hypothetical protein HB364_22960 [Pseudoflavitalea sp. X16]|uniref:RagB/SusD family nutrient uptake outer membrane protein n=1 Tax=Paraflavitalea devenefica TaxID=2716334 RepID=UPI0014235931|nr:RagB/SusD family nutrient uptake outer membrane protein [Paraflavitalea devenefica]NII27963.1 hypothetical protein [Paraflavitalea devenefica]
MNTLKYSIGLAALLSIAMGCKKELDVKNNNEPSAIEVYATGDDVESVASTLFNNAYKSSHAYAGVYMFLATSSDNTTCSWGNQSMRDMSWEPRNAWNNAPNYTYQGTTKTFFDGIYEVAVKATNIMNAIKRGVDMGDNENMVKAFCKFGQGVVYGNMALVFDKGFIEDENITNPNATPATAATYKQVAAAAVAYLDTAILLSATPFTIPKDWMGTAADLSNTDFIKLCNSMAARILANVPRNKTQLAEVDWAKVKAYADAGITGDFTIQMDGYTKWYAEAADYLTSPGWGQTDMYVIHLMDPAQPQHWDDSPSFPWPAASTNPPDKRLLSDFQYLSSTPLNPTRGYYHFSNYRASRYDASFALGDGPIPEFMKAENDLYKAEARVYLNDLAGAATIINAGTRSTRGQLADVAAVKEDLIQAIHHERHVELMNTGLGLSFFEMRKLNLLQKGTPLHWPLPAKTLETFRETLPFYTFGGVANADGTNTSNGGWR